MKVMFNNLLSKKAQEMYNCKTFCLLPQLSIGWSKEGVSIDISWLIFNILIYNTETN